jgi:signal transduction histidine kinase
MISARSKELEFQQEELRTQIEFTTIQNHKIEKQNLELERHRQHLERLVRQRTADLEAAKKRAEESDRLKSSFLANMSHEIRTPMNAIVGFTNIMIEEQLNEGERKELLEHIHDSSNYLLKLIENIIDISKIESGDLKFKYRPVHLNKLVEEVRDDYLSHQELVRKKLAFNVQQESPNRDVSFRTDVYRVKQILNNLIDNAIKFTYKGEITLGYRLTTLNNHSAVEFFVEDTGIGMTPQQQEHIFDLFRKNSGNQTTLYGGTGIGLTICRKLTLNLGGHIDVESQSGEGARFSVVIPHMTVKERQDQDNASSKYSIYRTKSLLLLGSKPGFHSTLKEKLENEEVRFHTAREGQEALQVFERNREQIDMIIVEAHKSCEEHMETVHKLRKMDESVPIVGITHEFTRHHNEQLQRNTFDEFFHYDVKPHRLLGWICEHSS